MLVRDAVPVDLPAITDIFNHAIETSVANFDLAPYTVDQRRDWFAQFGREHPLLVCEEAGAVLGFAYYTAYRTKAAYDATKETTIYVHHAARQRGVATRLYTELIARARASGLHVLIAVLGGENPESVALHRKLGFVQIGHLHEVGRKFGAWVDTYYYQLTLG